MDERDEAFARFLVDAGIVSRTQLQSVRAAKGDAPLSRVLVESGTLEAEDAARALAKSLSIPWGTLAPEEINTEALFHIPEPYARAQNTVAYAKDGDDLYVALLDMESLDALEDLRLPFRLKVRLTDGQSMKRALLQYQQALAERYAHQIKASTSPEHMVDALLLHALSQQARVVHLEPSEHGLRVRYRIGGALYDAMQLPAHAAKPITVRLKSLAKIAPEEIGEGRFSIARADGERTGVSVNALRQHDGESLVLHIVRDVQMGTLLSLGLYGEALEHVYRALEEHSGLILVCGPQESATSALLDALREQATGPQRKVVVVDATEGLSLVTRLRAALRHDPDVVVISDIRDSEAAALATAAANRGVLVIAGLAARSAPSGIEYLEGLVSPRTLAGVLTLAISAQIVPALCPRSEATKLTRQEIDALEAHGVSLSRVLATLKKEGNIPSDAQWKDVPFFKAIRCPECDQGYAGTVGLFEVLPTSMTLRRDIEAEASADTLAAEAYSEGVLSILEDGVYKAALGKTTVEALLQLE